MWFVRCGISICQFPSFKNLLRSGFLALLLQFSPVAVFGQGIVTGTIAGTIQDPQGAVIAGAAIQAVDTATGASFSSKSDPQGYFELRSLPLGSYSLTIEASGFRKQQLTNVIVEAGITN